MSEPASGAGAALLAKLWPAGLGALIVIAVDPPNNRRELFLRVFVAFACSYLFGDVVFDFLRTTGAGAFLDASKRGHATAVDGFVGAVGWFFVGAASVWLRKFKRKPLETISETKQAVKP